MNHTGEGRQRLKALGDLLKDIEHSLLGKRQAKITGLAYDSRKVRPGDFFLCRAAGRLDGHSFIPQAVAAGAAAVMVNADKQSLAEGMQVPVVVVPDTREAMAVVATAF